MKKILIGTIILCILHSILLVNQSLGINVVLFTPDDIDIVKDRSI